MGRITIIQGHPDPAGGHFCHALAQAYSQEVIAAGHEVKEIDIAHMDFPVLRSKDAWENAACPEAIRETRGSAQRRKWLAKLAALGRAGE